MKNLIKNCQRSSAFLWMWEEQRVKSDAKIPKLLCQQNTVWLAVEQEIVKRKLYRKCLACVEAILWNTTTELLSKSDDFINNKPRAYSSWSGSFFFKGRYLLYSCLLLFFSFRVYFSSKLNIVDACVVVITLIVTMIYTFSDLSGASLIPRWVSSLFSLRACRAAAAVWAEEHLKYCT